MRKTIFIAIFSLLQLSLSAQILSLDSCKVLALENNKKQKEAILEQDAAVQVKKNAFTKYFPKIEATALAMKTSKPLLELDIPAMNLPVYNGNPATLPTATEFAYFPGMNLEMLDYTNAAFVTAIQPVFAGGRIYFGNQLAQLGVEVSALKASLTQDEILLDTEYYFWSIISLQEKRKTLASYHEMLLQLEKDASSAAASGLIQKSDLLKVQLELNKLKANELKLNNGIELLSMSLAQHIGIPYSDSLSFSAPLLEDSEEIKWVNSNGAIQQRSEYQMLQKAADAELLQKKITRGALLPQVAIGVQALYLDVIEQQNTYGFAFATVSVPISDWWGGSYEIKEQQIKMEMAQNKLEETSELLELQIEKAYKDLIESREQISVSEKSCEQAKEHFRVMQDNHQAGLVKTSDLLEARALMQESSDVLWDAKTNFQIKKAQYLKAIAGLRVNY